MTALIPLGDVPRIAGKTSAAGFFRVPRKGSDVVRLIVDRRRTNALERPLTEVLAEVAALPDIQASLPDDEYGELGHLLECLLQDTLPHASQFLRHPPLAR